MCGSRILDPEQNGGSQSLKDRIQKKVKQLWPLKSLVVGFCLVHMDNFVVLVYIPVRKKNVHDSVPKSHTL